MNEMNNVFINIFQEENDEILYDMSIDIKYKKKKDKTVDKKVEYEFGM